MNKHLRRVGEGAIVLQLDPGHDSPTVVSLGLHVPGEETAHVQMWCLIALWYLVCEPGL